MATRIFKGGLQGLRIYEMHEDIPEWDLSRMEDEKGLQMLRQDEAVLVIDTPGDDSSRSPRGFEPWCFEGFKRYTKKGRYIMRLVEATIDDHRYLLKAPMKLRQRAPSFGPIMTQARHAGHLNRGDSPFFPCGHLIFERDYCIEREVQLRKDLQKMFDEEAEA